LPEAVKKDGFAMSGIGSGPRSDDHFVVAAFHHALVQQFLVGTTPGCGLFVLLQPMAGRPSWPT
jgi:hypothetical protein